MHGWLILMLVASSFGPMAQNSARGFQTPSGNIHCLAYPLQGRWELRCDLLQTTNPPPPRPKDCPLDWGKAFYISPTGPAGRACHGDTVANPQHPKLAYGQSWSFQGFRCTSRQTGLRCTNQSQHGFELSKAQQTLF